MKSYAHPDTSHELVLQRYGNGVKLLRPECTHTDVATHYNVAHMLDMPFNVYFLNAESSVINLNEHSATSCGFSSTKDAIGRTVREVAKKIAAESTIKHDRIVMQSNTMIVQDEPYQRAADNVIRSSIAIKFPWYNSDNKIIGIFGCSIVLQPNDKYSPADALAALAQTGLLIPTGLSENKQTSSSQSPPTIHLTRREKDVLQQLSLGKSTKAIAQRLEISPKTVEEYLKNLKLKTGVYSRDALVEKVMQLTDTYSTLPTTNPLH
jgi:DNA-binding CsgD family transcriptional regulator